MKNFRILLLAITAGLIVFSSCEKEPDPTPTNELMEGVWELTAATQNDTSIYDKVTSFFPSFIQLDDKNSVNSTMGPLFMYIVYGDSRFINITSKLDEVFSYSDLSLTEGEWFIDKNKVVDNFTVEMKLRFPTMQTLNDVFDLLQVDPPEIVADAVDIVVYHKFKYVTIDISDDNPNQMIWEFTDNVVPVYNTKDQYGDPVLYEGVSTDSFSRCKLTFTKKVKSLTDLVTEASQDTIN